MKFDIEDRLLPCRTLVPRISVSTVHIYCPIWVKFDIRYLHINLLSIYGIRENWSRLPYGCKLDYIFACTVKLCDIREVKNPLGY